MTDPETVRRMIAECWRAPRGNAQVALADAAIQHADACGDPELAFDARMAGTDVYQSGGEPARGLVTFAWCLSEFDRHPDRYQGWYDTLMWHFKYVISSMTGFPEVPLDRAYAVLDDMQRRYQAGGHGLHPVYQYRWRVAAHVGDDAAADEWYQRWFAAPRDAYSDCVGCDPNSKVAHLSARGRYEDAVALAEPVLGGSLTCREQPHSMLTELLVPYLRTGRWEAAALAHRRAYRNHRHHRADLASIADHLYFCGVTGNHARGLELLERHLPWLEQPPSPYAAMRFAAAGALVLRRLVETGHGDDLVAAGGPVPTGGPDVAGGPGPVLAGPGGGGDGVPVAVLRETLASRATDLAARFDARNGTTHQSRLIADLLAAGPLVEQLPLSATAARLRARAGELAGRDPQPAGAPADPSGAPAGPAGAAPEFPADAPVAEQLKEVDRRLRQGRTASARSLWARLERQHPVDGLAPVDRAEWEQIRGQLLVDEGDRVGAEAAWQQAAAQYEALGDEIHRQRALGMVGLAHCLTGRMDSGAALVEASTAYLTAHAPADVRSGALLRLAVLRLLREQPEAALAVVTEAAAYAEAGGDPLRLADVSTLRLRCLAALADPERGDPELRQAAADARQQCRTAGSPHLAEAALQHAALLAVDGERDAALAAFDESLSVPGPHHRIGALVGRARVLGECDRADEAVRDLVEAVALATSQADAGDLALLQFELAQAYLGTGQALDAAETAEQAVPGLDRAGAQDAADRCRYLLVNAYRELGETGPALRLLDTLVANLDSPDQVAVRAGMHEDAGDVLAQTGRDREAAGRYQSAAGGYDTAEQRVDQLRALRKQLAALRWSDLEDEAMALVPAAEAVVPLLPAEEPAGVYERAMLGYETAGLLGQVAQPGQARDLVEGVADTLRGLGATVDAALAELLHGEILLHLDQPEPAEQRLRAGLRDLPHGSGPATRCAWLLVEALTQLGRDEAAEAVRAEHGLAD